MPASHNWTLLYKLWTSFMVEKNGAKGHSKSGIWARLEPTTQFLSRYKPQTTLPRYKVMHKEELADGNWQIIPGKVRACRRPLVCLDEASTARTSVITLEAYLDSLGFCAMITGFWEPRRPGELLLWITLFPLLQRPSLKALKKTFYNNKNGSDSLTKVHAW